MTLTFLDTPVLNINTFGGNDTIAMQTPAPLGEAWDVQTNIDGGPPTPSGDSLLIASPAANPGLPNSIVYVPA